MIYIGEERPYSIAERIAMKTGTVVLSGLGNKWRKRPDGRWDVLTDQGWGPSMSEELPRWLTVLDRESARDE